MKSALREARGRTGKNMNEIHLAAEKEKKDNVRYLIYFLRTTQFSNVARIATKRYELL